MSSICETLYLPTAQIAKQVGCNNNSITRWLNGTRHSPNLERKLAAFLASTPFYPGMTVAELRQLVGLDKETAA
jgi:transcriptional regulator with XRE-family HTH domain